MHYITAPQPLAAALVKYGDFLAPAKGTMRYGYGCLLYSHFCDFSNQGARGLKPSDVKQPIRQACLKPVFSLELAMVSDGARLSLHELSHR